MLWIKKRIHYLRISLMKTCSKALTFSNESARPKRHVLVRLAFSPSWRMIPPGAKRKSKQTNSVFVNKQNDNINIFFKINQVIRSLVICKPIKVYSNENFILKNKQSTWSRQQSRGTIQNFHKAITSSLSICKNRWLILARFP